MKEMITTTIKDEHDGAPCSYYGSLEPIKPKRGVAYFVLDEYLKRSIDNEVEKARKEFQHMNDVCRKAMSIEFKELERKVDKLDSALTALTKKLMSVITENELKIPEKELKLKDVKK